MNPPAPCILIVEDEPQIRRFLDTALRAQGYITVLAATGQEGIERAATRKPDLVVLDLGLPDMEGHEVLSQLRQWSNVPVLILSVRDAETEKVRALDTGANDYVTKPFGIEEIMARVRALLRDHAIAPGEAPRFDDGRLIVDLALRKVCVDGEPVQLSRKEYSVLSLLARHPDRVLTQQQLLREVWGDQHAEDTHYLRIVVGKLRQKLGDDASDPRWIITEPGVGYRLRSSTPAVP
ncbi:MAG: response regulator [Rhodanobacteraceae bacterium]